ncbi:putative LMBR1-like membrane protein [Monocercomonoides exilis]|uniref:putative LMBR1-like membrane protein n=1 Tax=Monocercomonoides exilis TaxID=2049356 RepID=UPI00355A44C2|nr:putative LMBR1-like membrane protein [Monocercomonoides exilis]|eukprot:MONOS_3776.1-p1 / transcript=MONOS_3776.1 / gene=MONOS_3776 / organism=Monocercomonoides_exilis_PA203 / gene_product=unspecified product / transcript_product=unspecified product / location=Mono_scaffold00092:55483-58306(-) / protein_length=686 / sequence_SO=supercontig / SO=protein_coding / is_pseudo=false
MVFFRRNGRFYLTWGILGLIGLIFLIAFGVISLLSVKQLVIAISSFFQMCLYIVMLGVGLIYIPKKLWRRSNLKAQQDYHAYLVAKHSDSITKNVNSLTETCLKIDKVIEKHKKEPKYDRYLSTLRKELMDCQQYCPSLITSSTSTSSSTSSSSFRFPFSSFHRKRTLKSVTSLAARRNEEGKNQSVKREDSLSQRTGNDGRYADDDANGRASRFHQKYTEDRQNEELLSRRSRSREGREGRGGEEEEVFVDEYGRMIGGEEDVERPDANYESESDSEREGGDEREEGEGEGEEEVYSLNGQDSNEIGTVSVASDTTTVKIDLANNKKKNAAKDRRKAKIAKREGESKRRCRKEEDPQIEMFCQLRQKLKREKYYVIKEKHEFEANLTSYKAISRYQNRNIGQGWQKAKAHLQYSTISLISLKILSILCALLSFLVVWGEVTMFIPLDISPLSLLLHSHAFTPVQYLLLLLLLVFLALSAFSTLSRLRLFSFLHLVPDSSDPPSLFTFAGWSAMLTAPLCQNILVFLHTPLSSPYSQLDLDAQPVMVYSTVVNVMKVAPFVGDGFVVYFPLLIVFVIIITFFNVGDRILSCCRLKRFGIDQQIDEELAQRGRAIADSSIAPDEQTEPQEIEQPADTFPIQESKETVRNDVESSLHRPGDSVKTTNSRQNLRNIFRKKKKFTEQIIE